MMRTAAVALLALACVLFSVPASAQFPKPGRILSYDIKLSNATFEDLNVDWSSHLYKCNFPAVLKSAQAEWFTCRGEGNHDALNVRLYDTQKHGCEAQFTVYIAGNDSLTARVDSSRATYVKCRATAAQQGQIKIER
jgi:hypothetical protein